MAVNVGHRLFEKAPALATGRLVPQLRHAEQNGGKIAFQVRCRHIPPHQVQAPQGREGLPLSHAQGGGEAGRREAGREHEVLAEGFGAQGLLHAADIFVREAGNFLGAGALHHAEEDGRVYFPGVQLVQVAVPAAHAREKAHGIRRQHMLLGQDVPIGPEAGHLLEAGGKGAEPLGGTPHRHIPALLRGIGRVLLPHRIHAAAGQLLHPGGLAFEQQGVGGQVPTEKDVLWIF